MFFDEFFYLFMSNIIGDAAAERKAWLDFDNKSFTLDENGIAGYF